jgi:hypothetical protein
MMTERTLLEFTDIRVFCAMKHLKLPVYLGQCTRKRRRRKKRYSPLMETGASGRPSWPHVSTQPFLSPQRAWPNRQNDHPRQKTGRYSFS